MQKKSCIESENKFKTLLNNSRDEIYIIDFHGNFIEVNKAICDDLGYDKDMLIKMNVKEIKSEKFTHLTTGQIEKIKKEKFLVFESEHVTKEGKIIPVEIKSIIIDNNNSKAILCIARDIIDSKQTEQKVLNAIIETEEKERDRFAKDLHDGLGTLLSSISIYINIIKSDQINETERKNLLNNIKSLIDEAMLSAKEIANNFRPDIISRFGLIASINLLCEKVNNTGVLKIYFNSNGIKTDEIQKDIEVVLYRIVNELINNTLKHAFAKEVKINLLSEFGFLTLIYSDNGIGFDVEKTMNIKDTKGMGLSNLLSRVKAINGTFQINSVSKKGTEVLIKVKL